MSIEVQAREKQDGENAVDHMQQLRRPLAGEKCSCSGQALDRSHSRHAEKARPEPAGHRVFAEIEVSAPEAQDD